MTTAEFIADVWWHATESERDWLRFAWRDLAKILDELPDPEEDF